MQAINVSSPLIDFKLSDRELEADSQYQRVLNFRAHNDEPNFFTYNFDIKIGKDEEAMTLLQD